MFLVLGEPKTGKTWLAMNWPGCLVIDTQGGARHYGGMTVDVRKIADEEGKTDLQVFREVTQKLRESGAAGYSAVAIDTLDDVSQWLEKEAAERCAEKMNKPKGYFGSIEDVPHGAGWGEHRRMVMGLVKVYHRLPVTTLLIAHSRRLIDEETGEHSKMIDLPGRLGHMVPGEVDHIAVAARTAEGAFELDFSGYETRTSKGYTVRHSGSRFVQLNGKRIPTSYEGIKEAVSGRSQSE